MGLTARTLCLFFFVASIATFGAGCYESHDVSGDSSVVRPSPVTMPCSSGMMTGSRRDCGFRVESTQSCTPGRMISVGCGCGDLGSCTGDAVLRICRGETACRVDESLTNVDDSCGLCPLTMFVCPSEGRYTILSAPYSTTYTCTIGIR